MKLEAEAKDSLEELLKHGDWDRIKEYREAENYPILFDYIVPWECRLMTPREGQHAS